MRSCGIDLGKVRVGLAVSDELGLMAHARPHLDGKNVGRLVDALCDLVTTEGIELFVVGLPLTLAGQEGTAARRARRFAEELKRRSRVNVILMDERLTTKQAQLQLREAGQTAKQQRHLVDSVAAVLLLQTYLDAMTKTRKS